MEEAAEFWYFLTMASTGAFRRSAPRDGGIPRIAFDRRKYGRDLLIDVAWVRELRGFIIGAPHALAFFEIMLVTRGRGSLWLDDQRHPVRAGSIFFTTPGQIRRWDTTGLDGVCLFFEEFFTKDFLQDDAFLRRLPYFRTEPARAALPLPPPAARRVRERFTAMRGEIAHQRRDSIDLLRATLHETLIVLARYYGAAHHVATQRATHPVVSRYLDLVEHEAARRHRVADYASQLAITPGHLSTLCEQYLGRRAKRVLDDALVARARRMLVHTNDSAARIAAALGFEDPSYFSRFVRRETGQTPREIRNAARG